MGIELRRAGVDDAAAVADLFLDSFHATYAFPLAHTDEEVREWIRERLIPNDEVWVAAEGDRVVGFMALAPGWLEQLYVDPDHLGEGMQLWTFQVNARARRFYESHGFVAVEETADRNQERQPDVRYVWEGPSPAAPGRYAAEP